MSETHARFEELLERAWIDPEAREALERGWGAQGAVLVAGWTGSRARLSTRGPAFALASARQAERAVRAALDPYQPSLVRRLRDGLLVVFGSPEAALLGGLDGLAALAAQERAEHAAGRHGAPWAGVGLGFGDMLLDPAGDATGLEVDAAMHLAGAAGPGELLATDAFRAALGSPPPGVGLHRGRADHVERIGLPFSVFQDYRA